MPEFMVATVKKATDIPAELEHRYAEGWALLQAYWGTRTGNRWSSEMMHVLIFIRSATS